MRACCSSPGEQLVSVKGLDHSSCEGGQWVTVPLLEPLLTDTHRVRRRRPSGSVSRYVVVVVVCRDTGCPPLVHASETSHHSTAYHAHIRSRLDLRPHTPHHTTHHHHTAHTTPA